MILKLVIFSRLITLKLIFINCKLYVFFSYVKKNYKRFAPQRLIISVSSEKSAKEYGQTQ